MNRTIRNRIEVGITRWMKSRAAIARISEQETREGQWDSTNAFALMILSNPSSLNSLFSYASLSANFLLPFFVSINIDPSQPFKIPISTYVDYQTS